MYEKYRGERVSAEILHPHGLSREVLPVHRGRATGFLAAIAACLLLASILVLFLQVQGFVSHLEAKWAAETGGSKRLHAINEQVEALQGKFNSLLAESVELRLKALERSVESGRVAVDDLRTFESLRADLLTLENYADRVGAKDFDYPSQEHDRYQAIAASPPPLRNTALKSELAELKVLFYGFLGVLAVALLAMFRYWLIQRRAIRRLERLAIPPMLASPATIAEFDSQGPRS